MVKIREVFVPPACLLILMTVERHRVPADHQILNAVGVQALQKLFEVFG